MSNNERASVTRGARAYARRWGGSKYSISADKRSARRANRRWNKRDTVARNSGVDPPRQPQPCNHRY